eukprot:scaffold1654_cov340-Prasinococcus_capsulatus_cf.AAC.12
MRRPRRRRSAPERALRVAIVCRARAYLVELAVAVDAVLGDVGAQVHVLAQLRQHGLAPRAHAQEGAGLGVLGAELQEARRMLRGQHDQVGLHVARAQPRGVLGILALADERAQRARGQRLHGERRRHRGDGTAGRLLRGARRRCSARGCHNATRRCDARRPRRARRLYPPRAVSEDAPRRAAAAASPRRCAPSDEGRSLYGLRLPLPLPLPLLLMTTTTTTLTRPSAGPAGDEERGVSVPLRELASMYLLQRTLGGTLGSGLSSPSAARRRGQRPWELGMDEPGPIGARSASATAGPGAHACAGALGTRGGAASRVPLRAQAGGAAAAVSMRMGGGGEALLALRTRARGRAAASRCVSHRARAAAHMLAAGEQTAGVPGWSAARLRDEMAPGR